MENRIDLRDMDDLRNLIRYYKQEGIFESSERIGSSTCLVHLKDGGSQKIYIEDSDR